MPISQTGNKRQEQAADNFSTSWKLASYLTLLGGSVTPKFRRCRAHQGVSGGGQPFPLPNASCLPRGGGPGH